MVVLDTNIIIDHLRLQEAAQQSELEYLTSKYPDAKLGLSVISIQELFEGKSTKNARKLAALYKIIKPLLVLECDTKIAKRAGELARDTSVAITFADAAIAATALEHNSQLATLNTKHFSHIAKLRLAKLQQSLLLF
ncbi:MAG: hypothetical protein COU67_00400 [Candidatus Pacebacteria bacterium CG10_big_fil_rev_8_21_14_0_10_44_54]|nr:MAG: hypothetical protein COU67_00400 [Candidatus Pacebacteria bacterium CG10_big_fil_rev_8_21_14_0_10_44_54]